MGAWGSGSFENDDALDAVDALVDGSFTLDELREAVAGDYLEAPEGSVALALVEVALAALGRIDPPAELDEVDIRLLATQLDDAAYELILTAAERVVQPDGSELYELWEDAGEDELAEWRTAAVSSVDLLRSAIAE
ncbi:DUF4259 domain-containing protein [Microcella humidisoli]|uniref:DUF4259 domain-containing protein n=1 Tax=Microcella humidisoli TaxID=2963406 RepID=A0ABY5FXG4_9MICO|nr:DUF4259 domain-containing protein [Microcella humidisoli]UTT62824.1 DUF4259 domain-containing protein [Microcella humidisoli]